MQSPVGRLLARHRRGLLLVGLLCGGLVVGGLFVVDVSESVPEPVPFDDTRSVGFASEDAAAIEDDRQVPRAQVFFSQYQYVIGYNGIGTAVDALDDPMREQQFGYPLVTYVTAYDDTLIELGESGRIEAARDPAWVRAESASYVLDSGASTPAGPAAVPFADRQRAAAFAEATGGRVVAWDELSATDFEADDATLVRERVDRQRAAADQRVAERLGLFDREPAVTVSPGESLQEAVASAPNGSAVVVEPGTYAGPVEIDRSITLRAQGATVEGTGTGTPVGVSADDVAIDGLRVTGIGNETRDEDAATDGGWDRNIELGYGHGDAGIAAVGANGTVVTNVTIPETPANGLLLRDSPGAVVRNLTVTGSEEWADGFMGVMVMRSPAVIEDSTFHDGRDGIYLHRSEGTVIRESAFRGGRYGVHLMHTSGSLLADNRFTDHELGGITIMTTPTSNAVVGNVVANTTNAISTSGSNSYIAHNIAVGSRIGITTSAVSSLYEHNVVRDNEFGMRTGSVLATSRVWKNDFVDNRRHAGASAGPLRVWAHDGQGNYWEGAYGGATGGATGGPTGGTYDRAYVPTDPVDGGLHRTPARYTLAESPVTLGLRALRGAAPGLRAGSIIDPAPQAAPQNPAAYRLSEAVSARGLDALATTNTTMTTTTATASATATTPATAAATGGHP